MNFQHIDTFTLNYRINLRREHLFCKQKEEVISSVLGFCTMLIVYPTLFLLVSHVSASANNGFVFNGNFSMDGLVEGSSEEGPLMLTNSTKFSMGHAFYSFPFTFKNISNGNAFSFSTSFVFAIVPPDPFFAGDGMAFVISPSKKIEGVASKKYLGLFNETNFEGNSSNHIIAIELDTYQNEEFQDIDGNHVGIDINSLTSVKSSPAGYFVNGEFKNLSLVSGDAIQAWAEYDGVGKQLNVTLSPVDHAEKPSQPLLSAKIDISPYVLNDMYVGFSAATGALVQSSYVLAWSFQMNGRAEELDLSKLPSLPGRKGSKRKPKLLAILLPVIGSVSILTAIFVIIYLLRKKSKFAEVLEDWEVQYGPHRFSYKDLYVATKAFSEKELLGSGGFGQVYRGVLTTSKNEIAVKRISHNSKQGMKEFVAEIATIGRLRHPNLVRLLGYCRRKGELFLVYDYMPNASLDKFIFDNTKASLSWSQRFNIIKDVASGLAYLHEELVEVIIHRDIKASNVLLDSELNGKLSDFGLARSIYLGKDLQTTQIAGTLGYIAPELARNGKANTKTDVFAFGAFCLEVACGRRPLEQRAPPGEVILLDWVVECWKKGEILRTTDPKLGNDFNVEQMELVLKLGLLCTHLVPEIRPRMSDVKRYLHGDASVLENLNAILTENWKDLQDFAATDPLTSETQESKASVTISDMFISIGR